MRYFNIFIELSFNYFINLNILTWIYVESFVEIYIFFYLSKYSLLKCCLILICFLFYLGELILELEEIEACHLNTLNIEYNFFNTNLIINI